MADLGLDGVAVVSKEIAAAELKRKISRDFFAGQEAVWDASTEYLPLLEGEDHTQAWGYPARLKLSRTVPYVSRAVLFAEGQVFQKPVKFGDDVPVKIRGQEEDEEKSQTEVMGWAENIDLQGRNATRFFRERFRDLLTSGLAIWVADTPPKAEGEVSQAEDKRRPYLVGYHSSSLIARRWMVTPEGRRRLAHVRLKECVKIADPKDKFGALEQERIRVYDSQGEGDVRLTVYAKGEDKHWFIAHAERAIVGLVDIPVALAGDEEGVGMFHHLAHLTAFLYRKESDHSNFEHVACVPQGYIGGLSPEEKEALKTGFVRAADRTMLFSSDAKPGFWEPQGGSLEHIRQSITELKAEIEAESVRALTEKASGGITATEAVINTGQNVSRLQAEWLSFVDWAEWSLAWLAQLGGLGQDGGKVDRERTWQDLRPDSVKLEWIKFLMEKRALSVQGAFEIAKRERAIPEDSDYEVEKARVDDEGGDLGMIGEGQRLAKRVRELQAQGLSPEEALAKAEAEQQFDPLAEPPAPQEGQAA